MNPFDLRGPEFLGFYVVFAAVVLLAAWLLRRFVMDDDSPPPRISDPYVLAFVRGGADEALKTALFALAERGALTVDGSGAEAVAGARFGAGLEAALGSHFAQRRAWKPAKSDPAVGAALGAIESRLRVHGLLPNATTRLRRVVLLVCVETALLGVAATKVAIALSRGRTNVAFLVGLAGVAAFIAWRISSPRSTRRGDRLLSDLRTLLVRPRRRPVESSATDAADWAQTVALYAAVCGPSMAPGDAALKRHLWPPAPAATSSDGSSIASSCGGGSSCGGSSCGGGCGGGGCGGCGS